MAKNDQYFLINLLIATLGFFVFIVIFTAEGNQEANTSELDEIIGMQTKIYPHSDECRRVYHQLEKTNALICLIDGQLVVNKLATLEEVASNGYH